MKKLLFILLLLPAWAFAQNTVTLETGTAPVTPQFRYKAVTPDSLNHLWIFNPTTGKYNRIFTATEANQRFGGATLSFLNGLTKTSSTVKLGGTLTNDTYIPTATHEFGMGDQTQTAGPTFTLNDSQVILNSSSGGSHSGFTAATGISALQSNTTTDASNIFVQPSKISLLRPNTSVLLENDSISIKALHGAQYHVSVHNSDLLPNSLAPVGYVDSAVNAGGRASNGIYKDPDVGDFRLGAPSGSGESVFTESREINTGDQNLIIGTYGKAIVSAGSAEIRYDNYPDNTNESFVRVGSDQVAILASTNSGDDFATIQWSSTGPASWINTGGYGINYQNSDSTKFTQKTLPPISWVNGKIAAAISGIGTTYARKDSTYNINKNGFDILNKNTFRNNLNVASKDSTLTKNNNLFSITNKAAARANLGVPVKDSVLLKTQNLFGLQSPPTARLNLGFPNITANYALYSTGSNYTGTQAFQFDPTLNKLYVNATGTGTSTGATGSIQLGDATISKANGSPISMSSAMAVLSTGGYASFDGGLSLGGTRNLPAGNMLNIQGGNMMIDRAYSIGFAASSSMRSNISSNTNNDFNINVTSGGLFRYIYNGSARFTINTSGQPVFTAITTGTAGDSVLTKNGTTNIVGKIAASAFTYTADGTTLNLSTNQFSIKNIGTPGTYTSVTTDASGRVISGSNPTVGSVTSFSKTDNFGIISSVTNPTTTPNYAAGVDTTNITARNYLGANYPKNGSDAYFQRVRIVGTAGNGYLDLLQQSVSPAALTGHLRVYADSLNRLSWKNSTYRRTIQVPYPLDATIRMPYKATPTLADSTDIATKYAPLASPAFTGTPTTPNATVGSNAAQVTNQKYVTDAIAGIAPYTPGYAINIASNVISSDSTLSATRLYVQNYTYSKTQSNLIYAPLASPAFTGTPTAPTAAANTNTTQLATTAHVFAERSNTRTLTNATINLPTPGTASSLNFANGSPSSPVAGDVYRSGNNLVFFSTVARTLANLNETQTLINKTLAVASNSITGTASRIATFNSSGNLVSTGAYLRLTGSGTGAATTISIAHGLTGVTSTSIVTATAKNAASAGFSYVTSDATNINFIYTVAPASGTANLAYDTNIIP